LGLITSATAWTSEPEKAKKVVYLTFDDGPMPGTESVLDVLKEFGAPATFFLTGSNQATLGKDAAKVQADLVRRMMQEGHAVGNHCYKHDIATKKQYRAAYGELKTSTQKSAFDKNLQDNTEHFRDLLGAVFQFPLARLPGDGRYFPVYVKEVERLGYRHIAWKFEFAPNAAFSWVDNDDWQEIKGVAASSDKFPEDNAVILFHDKHWKGPRTALFKSILKKLQDAGYNFGKL
jgi:peptidoglycan/xylan/chitin deacetylase (PgdA/CDA1 family)